MTEIVHHDSNNKPSWQQQQTILTATNHNGSNNKPSWQQQQTILIAINHNGSNNKSSWQQQQKSMEAEHHHCRNQVTFGSTAHHIKTTRKQQNHLAITTHNCWAKTSLCTALCDTLTACSYSALCHTLTACSYRFALTVGSSSFISHSHQAETLHHPQHSHHHPQWECQAAVPHKGAAGGRQTVRFNKEWFFRSSSTISRQTLDELEATPTPSSDCKMRTTKENIL